MSVAQLGISVESKDAKRAVVDLDALTASAGKAEAAAAALATGAKKGEAAAAQLATAVGRAGSAAGVAAGEIQRNASAIILDGNAAETATAHLHRYTQAMNDNAKSSERLAFQRRNLSYQLFDISQSLALGMPPLMVALQQGPQIAQIWGAGEGGIGRAFAETAGMIGRFTVAALPLAAVVGGVSLAFAGLTREIHQAGRTQVSFWDTLVATAEVSGEAILRALDPVWTGVQNGFGRVWDFIQPTLKLIGNTMIASFVGAFEHIKFLFGNNGEGLGSIIAAGVIGGVNLAIDAINKLIQGATEGLNRLIKLLNQIPGMGISEIGSGAQIPQLDNPALRNAQRLTSERDSNISEAFGTDYLGDAFESISKRAQEVSERLSEEEQKRLERLAKQQAAALERRVEQHQQALLSEEDAENLSHQKRLEDLQAYYEAGKITQEEYHLWTQAAEEKHAENLTKIAQEQAEKEASIRSQLLSSVGSIFGSLSQLAESAGGKNLAAAKAFGIAEAVVNTAQGITKALTLPFPLNWAQAAAVGAAGAAQIATIASARPGSARQPSVGGSSGSTSTTQQSSSTAEASRTAYFNITGTPNSSTFTREQLIEMLGQIEDLQRDGYKIVLGGS